MVPQKGPGHVFRDFDCIYTYMYLILKNDKNILMGRYCSTVG